MKISWGLKITLLYIGFVVLILSMVALTMRENVDLVSKDYYAQELKFQDKIDKINNSNQLDQSLSWEISPEDLVLKYPGVFQGKIKSGNICFFRPSDSRLDKSIILSPDTSGIKHISLNNLQKGVYKIQINWNADDKEYYNEGVIQIN